MSEEIGFKAPFIETGLFMCLEHQLHRCAQQNFALKVSILIGSSTTGRLIHGQSMPYKDDGVQMESVGLKVPIPMYNSSMSSQLP